MAAAGEADHTAPAHLYREASRSVYSGLQSHFNSRTLADISIVRPDGRLIHAHQVILAACSRKLSSVLAYGDATGKELPIQGVDSNALETVIGFFYRGEVLLTVNTVVPVYDVCLKLEVPGLAAACEQFVQQALSVGTCCIFLEAAVQLLLEHTVKLCLAFAKSRFSEVVASTSFQQLSTEALRMMLVPMRSSISDVSMARALARWAVHRPEHLAECEQLLKELNVTAAALLQLLQSPEFLQGLQQQQQARAAAPGAAAGPGAGAVAAGAAAGGLSTGSGVQQQGRNREWDTAQARDSGAGGRGVGAAGGPGSAGGGKGPLASAGSGGGGLLQNRASGAVAGSGGGGGGHPGPAAMPQAVIQGVQIMKVPATGAPINVSGGTLNAPKRLSGNGGGGAVGGATSGVGGGPGGPHPPSPLRQGDRSLPAVDRSPAQQQRSPILGSAGAPGAGALGSMGARDRAPSNAARAGPLPDRESVPGLNGPPLIQRKSTGPAWPAGGEEADPPVGGGPGPGGRTQQAQQRGPPFGSAFGSGPGAGAEPLDRQLGQQQGLGTGLRGMDEDSASRDALAEGRRAPGAGPQGAGRGPGEGDEWEGSVHGGGPGGRRGAGPGAASAEGSQPQPQRGMAGGVGGEGGGSDGQERREGQQQQQPKGSMIAVPLHVLEHAGMGVQLMASGSVAVSGGPLGSQRLVLQVVTGPQQMLLALVPGLVAQQMQGGAPGGKEGQPPAVKEEEAPSGRTAGPAGVRDSAAGAGATAGGLLASQDAGGPVGGAGGGLGPVMAAVVKQQKEQQREQQQQQQQQQREGDMDPRLGPQVARLGRMGSDLPGGRGADGGGGGGAGGVKVSQGGSPMQVPPLGFSEIVGGLRTGILATGRTGLGSMVGATGAGPTDLAGVQPSLGMQRQQQQQLLQPPGLTGGSWPAEQGGEGVEGAGEGMPPFPGGVPGLGPGVQGDAGLGLEGPGGLLGGPTGGGGGGGKRRRASPEDDPDHVDEGSRGGGRSSRAGGYGGHGSKGPLMCHVDDCHVDLTALKEYHQRFRICDFHLKASVVLRDGIMQRFCQQCGRFHVLSEFDGTKRSCRARLQRHNARRRKRPDQKTSDWSDEGRKTSTGALRDSPASGPNPMGGFMRGVAGGSGSAGAFTLAPYALQQQLYPGAGAQRGGSDSPSPQDEDDPDQDGDGEGDGEMFAAAALQHLRSTEPHQTLMDRGGQLEEEAAAGGFGGAAGGGSGMHAVGPSGAFGALQPNRQELHLLQQRGLAQQQQQQYQGLLQQAASGGRDTAVMLGRSPQSQSMGGTGEVAGDVPLEQLDYRQLGQLGQQWRDGHVRQQLQLQQLQQQKQSPLRTQNLSSLPLSLLQQQQQLQQQQEEGQRHRQRQGGPQDPRMPPAGPGPADQEQLLMALRQQREPEREQQQQRLAHQQREQQRAAGEHMSDVAFARAREEEPTGVYQADLRERSQAQRQGQGQGQGNERQARQGGQGQGQMLGGGRDREAAGSAGGEQPRDATGRDGAAQPAAVPPEAAAAAAATPFEQGGGGGGGGGRADTDSAGEERAGPSEAGEGAARTTAEQTAGAGASAGPSPPRVERREEEAEEADQHGVQAAGTPAEAPK